jgi:hypothetical protein
MGNAWKLVSLVICQWRLRFMQPLTVPEPLPINFNHRSNHDFSHQKPTPSTPSFNRHNARCHAPVTFYGHRYRSPRDYGRVVFSILKPMEPAMTQPPSPTAQVVKAAAYHGVPSTHAHTLEWRIAAAIRALVEQTLPEEPNWADSDYDHEVWTMMQSIRREQLAVAAELEGVG